MHGFDIGNSLGDIIDLEMTSARRTNLLRIRALRGTEIPIISVKLKDLSDSTLTAYGEIQDGYRVIGNGTFRPSFGDGTGLKERLNEHRYIFKLLLYGCSVE